MLVCTSGSVCVCFFRLCVIFVSLGMSLPLPPCVCHCCSCYRFTFPCLSGFSRLSFWFCLSLALHILSLAATTAQHVWAEGLSPFPPVSSPQQLLTVSQPGLPARPSWALEEGGRDEGRAAWRAHPFLPFQAGRLGQ